MGFRCGVDHFSCLLGNYDRRRIGVAGCNARHHGSIDDSNACKPVHAERTLNHCVRIRTHACRHHRVKNCRRDVARRLYQFVIGLVLRHQFELFRLKRRKRPLGYNLSGQFYSRCREQLVTFG